MALAETREEANGPAYWPERRRYPVASRLFHWTVALLVLAVWPLGFVIAFIVEDTKPVFYLLHESLGFLVLWLMLARLAVRLIAPPPARPPMPLWQTRLAALVHGLLYAALIAMPVFGFLATNAFGFPLQWFALVEIPSPIGRSPEIAPVLMSVHTYLGWTILGLFALHVAGVVYHQAIRRDPTLQRMI